MPGLSRKGDRNQTGGRLVRGANTVFCDGIPVALHVSKITPHNPKPKKRPHCCAQTTQGSPTVFCEGVPVVRVGSGNSCGHSIVQGSQRVFVP
jgi:uncharacterized Zn-binding protein involved in type VI secretion